MWVAGIGKFRRLCEFQLCMSAMAATAATIHPCVQHFKTFPSSSIYMAVSLLVHGGLTLQIVILDSKTYHRTCSVTSVWEFVLSSEPDFHCWRPSRNSQGFLIIYATQFPQHNIHVILFGCWCQQNGLNGVVFLPQLPTLVNILMV